MKFLSQASFSQRTSEAHNSDHLRLRLEKDGIKVFTLVLISALGVILVRLFGPIFIHFDLSIQLEAAVRLVQGLGLTNAFSSQLDLNQPPVSQPLTHFPPGLSLLVAAFLYFDIPLIYALKIIYSLATLFGWIVWGLLSALCLADRIKIASKSIPVNLILAALLPIFYTPAWTWQGTDTFLWAGIPTIAFLLIFSNGSRRPWAAMFGSGMLVLGLIAFRYISVFILIGALFIVAYLNFPNWKFIFRRSFWFYLPSLLFSTSILILYGVAVSRLNPEDYSVDELLQNHGARYLSSDALKAFLSSLNKIFSSFSDLHQFLGVGSGIINSFLDKNQSVSIIFGILYLMLMGYVFFLIVRQRDQSLTLTNAVVFSLMCCIFAYVAFSILITFSLAYSPLSIERYYVPFIPALILILYTLATAQKTNRLFAAVLKVFIVFAIIPALLLKPAQYAIAGEVPELLSSVYRSGPTADLPYPSNKLLSQHQKSIDVLAEIEKRGGNQLFFIQNYPKYASYLSFDDPLKFRRIPDDPFWEKAYLSEPTRIYWVTNDRRCEKICASGGNFNSYRPYHSLNTLKLLPNLTTIYDGRTDVTANASGFLPGYARIMYSDLPAGYRFGEGIEPDT